MAESVLLREDLPALPSDLLLARDRGEVLFVVGAGASRPEPSGLPDFGGLVADIYGKVDHTMVAAIQQLRSAEPPHWNAIDAPLNDHQRSELKFFARGEFDVVLGMLERRIDTDLSKDSLVRQAALSVLGRNGTPNKLHSALVTLGERYGETLLVTTNFDRLLTHAARRARAKSQAYGLGQIPHPSRGAEFSGILHIHGMLGTGQQPASELILTDRDFGDHYLRRQTLTSFLYDAARIFRLVLVGYGANDAPVRYLLNAIASDERRFVDLKPRYAFVGCSPGDTRTPVEWNARGITPLPYDDANEHLILGELLTEWAAILPGVRTSKRVERRLKEISRLDPASATVETSRSFLRYVVRRSNTSERVQLAKLMSKAGANPGWLTLINDAIRRPEGEKR